MIHTVLTPVTKKGDRTSVRTRREQIAECGGLHHTGPYHGAAETISRLSWCERVIVTHVSETHVETWRNGVKT